MRKEPGPKERVSVFFGRPDREEKDEKRPTFRAYKNQPTAVPTFLFCLAGMAGRGKKKKRELLKQTNATYEPVHPAQKWGTKTLGPTCHCRSNSKKKGREAGGSARPRPKPPKREGRGEKGNKKAHGTTPRKQVFFRYLQGQK